jgi:hypothetical protein
VTALFFCTLCSQCYCYDYAVQPVPVEFSAVPQSQRVVEGDSVLLTCNFSVTRLGSNYPEPHTVWRKNGTEVLDAIKTTKSDADRGYKYTEYLLSPVMPHHTGYYECLAVDGKMKGVFVGEGKHVISSPRAYVHVVSLEDLMDRSESESGSGSSSILEPPGMETVTLLQGESFLIPCDVSLIATPSSIDWYRNETLTASSAILTNGSLLLHSAAMVDSGSYQCVVWFGNHSLEGPLLQISVSEDTYSGAPELVMDPSTATLTSGEGLNITCHVTGVTDPLSPPLQVQVARDGEVFLTESPVAGGGYKQFYVEESGRYECQLRQNGSVISRASTTVVSGSTRVIVFVGHNDEPLSCGEAAKGEFYWYRNGELLQFSDTTYRLTGESADLEGVYQCFILTSDGVWHQHTWRVFDSRFTNPPTNFRCKVKFSNVSYPWPRLEMQWQNPDFIALGEIPGFRVYSTFLGIDVNTVIRGFHYEIELDGIDDIETTEGVYQLLVRGDAQSNENEDYYLSAPARCDVNTLGRALNPPLPLDITCSNRPNQNVTIRWTNPLATGGLNVNIQLIELKATCLYGNHPLYNNEYSYDDEMDIFGYYDESSPAEQSYFDLILTTSDPSVASSTTSGGAIIPNGAVCVASGKYQLDHGTITKPTAIPRAMCITPPSVREGDVGVQLGVVCGGGVVEMTWNTSLTSFQHTTNITLHLTCLNSHEALDELFSVSDADLAGRESVSVEHSLCSFYGWFTDSRTGSEETITPAQCYMEQPNDVLFYPPVAVPNLTVYDESTPTNSPTTQPAGTITPIVTRSDDTVVPTSSTLSRFPIEIATNSTADTSSPYVAVLQFVIPSAVVSVAGLIVLLLIVVLRCRQSALYNAKQLQFLGDQELDKNHQPCNLNVMSDRGSIRTLYNDIDDSGQSSPPSVVGVEPMDFLSNVESSTEEASEGLKDGGTPALSPLITETALLTEDSGCDLQFELCPSAMFTADETHAMFTADETHAMFTADETHGKEQLFTKLLTGIDKHSPCTPPSLSSPEVSMQPESTIIEQRPFDLEVCDRPVQSASTTSFSDMVAHRLLVTDDSSAPSSGYGTTDGYDYSTGASEVSREYYARKLREVDEIAEEPDSIHESISIRSSTDNTAATAQELTSFSSSNQDSIPETLPSLLITSVESTTDTTCISTPQTSNLKTVNSASTGDISSVSSYYKDKEGYLHMAPLHTGLNPCFHHQSSEFLPKSL